LLFWHDGRVSSAQRLLAITALARHLFDKSKLCRLLDKYLLALTGYTKYRMWKLSEIVSESAKLAETGVNAADGWWLLRRQLTENARNAKSAAIGNIVNAAISTALFWNNVPTIAVVAFWLLVTSQIGWRISIARRVGAAGRDMAKLDRLSRELIGNAIGLGATWGITVKAMFVWGNPSDLVFAGIIGAGMMSAGMISYRTLRPAALGYVYACLPGCALALAADGNAASYSALGLLICFVGVLTANIRSTAKRFIHSTLREQELNRSRNTIKLLLHDHTEQGSDWLIAVDRHGRIIAPSKRFATAARRPVQVLEGMRFVDLLDDTDATAELRKIVRRGNPVRNHILSFTSNGEKRWWSISGKAVREERAIFRGVITDITAQRRAEDKVSYMAHYDGLTDLPNRFRFHEHLYRELCRERPVALLFMDLDHFKAVNDTLGHGVGDKLLQAAARRIESLAGKRAMVARLGGDEFAILLSGARVKDAEAVAEKVIKGLSESFSLGDHDAVVGATIGIAMAPEDGSDPEGLLRNADLALYAAKGQGRNRAMRYEPGMDEIAQERRLLEMDMRGALAKGEMCLHYQPLVDAHTSETTGYEALVRWVHPTRGIVMPSAFIPIAEETGLIVQLGEWVIRQAIDDMQRWDEHLTVSVNLSPAQMRSPALISTVINALAATGVNPSRLCMEITESVLMQDSDSNIQVLHKLREIGVQIALDDFGTGYSSLNYLRSFPFSKIKIDRCFVSEIDSREDCRAIIRSVVSLANSLGMSTTAEGVERIEQIEHLRREGCGEVQGFLFSQAVPVEELSNLRPVKNMRAAAVSALSGRRSTADESKQSVSDTSKAA
jgi:diguanylate cyclase (GGDEF)-like protein